MYREAIWTDERLVLCQNHLRIAFCRRGLFYDPTAHVAAVAGAGVAQPVGVDVGPTVALNRVLGLY